MAAQLLAAMLNLSAGAETCDAIVDAVNSATTLLADIGFDGTGSELKKKGKGGGGGSDDAATANDLASTLDDYNNGFLCP
jgi:hypothetical protein